MADESERRQPPYDLQRQIDQLGSKIERLEDKVGSTTTAISQSIEAYTKLLDERWKTMETRFDLTGRQHQQSLELLSTTVQRLDQHLSAAETELQIIAQDAKVEAAKMVEQSKSADQTHKDLYGRVETINANLTWMWRTIAASVIGVAIALITRNL